MRVERSPHISRLADYSSRHYSNTAKRYSETCFSPGVRLRLQTRVCVTDRAAITRWYMPEQKFIRARRRSQAETDRQARPIRSVINSIPSDRRTMFLHSRRQAAVASNCRASAIGRPLPGEWMSKNLT
jgi:hypothetical protein